MIRLTKSFEPTDSRLSKMEELVNANWKLLVQCSKLSPEDQKRYLPAIQQKINESKNLLQSLK